MASNPKIQQGTLNRVRTSVVVPAYTNLNVTAPYMGKQMARFAIEGNIADKIGTATGAVTSEEPYVFGTITISLLRTQALSDAWHQQAQLDADVGDVTLHGDTTTLDPITVNDCVIQSIDTGAMDGTDPIYRVTLRGTWIVNNNMWNI